MHHQQQTQAATLYNILLQLTATPHPFTPASAKLELFSTELERFINNNSYNYKQNHKSFADIKKKYFQKAPWEDDVLEINHRLLTIASLIASDNQQIFKVE